MGVNDPLKTESSGICHFCVKNICESEESWGYHHHGLLELKKSAASRCIFCTRLLHAIEPSFADASALSWPLYRWNFRFLTKTRDTQEVASIIFRPIINDEKVNGHDDKPKVSEQWKDLPELTFHAYLEDNVDYRLDGPELGPSTNSKQSWDQIHKWLEDCVTNHPMCNRDRQIDHPVPTRLLDISAIDPNGGPSGNMFVVNTKLTKIKEPYVTLSHSWGPNPKFIAMQAENEKEMMEVGFPFDHPGLTQNFRDAIMVARQLDKRYIWIDSVCILQKNAQDFMREAPLMHQYYRHSFCNIAASDAHLPSEGLFRTRGVADTSYPTTTARYIPDRKTKKFSNRSGLIVANDTWESQLLQNILYTRGWVFQERMLARRVLHFSRRQIFFECATMSACETLPRGLPRASGIRAATDRYWRQRLHHGSSLSDHHLSGSADLSIEEFWKTAVSTYTRCELTDRGDKVIAFQGVAKLVKDTLDVEEYAYGLWSARLEEQLAWRVDHCQQANGTPSARLRPLKFPSWSWASVNGIIDLPDRLPAIEREYSVRDHEGKPIKFEVSDRDDTISVPKVLRDGESHPHRSPLVHKSDRLEKMMEKVSILSPDQRKDKELSHKGLSAIEIRGYVRTGFLQQDTSVGKCTLSTKDFEDLKCEIFLDEESAASVINCSFLVLAYSRAGGKTISRHDSYQVRKKLFQRQTDGQDTSQTNQPRTTDQLVVPVSFSGVGLLLEPRQTDYWYRFGSFQFHNLTLAELSRLTAVQSPDWNLSDIVKDPSAKNIYLC